MTWNNRRRRTLGAFAKEQSGAAAVEMAIWLFILAVPMMNLIDVGLYVFQNMEVENAAQMAAQSAWAECGQQLQPASTKCPGFATALQRGAQSTTLTSSVSVSSSEDQYCVNDDGELEAGCAPSAYYLVVQASYNYAPMFAPVSVASLFPSPISRTTWRRMS
jgi:Flp pilus assembly protein TadG